MQIVYFDGVCNICNGFVDFLIQRDHARLLKYAPLQGATAHQRLPASMVTDLNTIVFEDEGKISTESSAAIRVIARLGGIYSWMKIFLLVPGPIRNGVYRLIAKNRYLLAGQRDTCRLPTAEERAQFLD